VSILIVFGIGIAAGLVAAFLGGGERRFLFVHAVVGIVGAMLGGILLARVVAHKPYNPYHFDAEAVIWACGGAILLLAALKLVQVRIGR
jgi:uncharacterized membrane protein YeaQ/YmgE (transglycosylase-associated protein family)